MADIENRRTAEWLDCLISVIVIPDYIRSKLVSSLYPPAFSRPNCRCACSLNRVGVQRLCLEKKREK
jgi:hypothetical protein